MEHLLNVYATRSARGAIADFVGYLEVRESEATMRLTQGLWLVGLQAFTEGRQQQCSRIRVRRATGAQHAAGRIMTSWHGVGDGLRLSSAGGGAVAGPGDKSLPAAVNRGSTCLTGWLPDSQPP